MTGCLGSEDVEFTILSEHAPGTAMFIWRKNGQVELVENAIEVYTSSSLCVASAIQFSIQDMERKGNKPINDEIKNPKAAAAAAAACTGKKCKDVPKTNSLNIRVCMY